MTTAAVLWKSLDTPILKPSHRWVGVGGSGGGGGCEKEGDIGGDGGGLKMEKIVMEKRRVVCKGVVV